MNQHSPARSLIERAAEVYDFSSFLRGTSEPVADVVADLPPPPPPPPVQPAELPRAGAVAVVDREKLAEGGFLLPDSPVSELAEELRLMKRQLLLAATAPDAAPRDRMLMIASARENEGKTFVAINLALSIANERDFEVLLVDADVARPSIFEKLGLETGPGLLDAVADEELDIEACVIRTDLPNFAVLPAGRPRHEATELIASERTRNVLDRLARARTHRVVIFDSPPALAASPASELAHHVGQVVLVVRADRTGEADVRDAAGLVGGCPRIQLLLNGVSYQGGGRRFGTYGYGD